MTTNTAIGEADVEIEGTVYRVRPSFAALASLGGESDIDLAVRACFRAFEAFCAGGWPAVDDIAICADVLQACSNIPEQYLGRHTGRRLLTDEQLCQASPARRRAFRWKPGVVPVDDLVVMANHCVKWGVMGDPKQKPKSSNEDGGLFNPQEFVAILIDEFGLGRAEAWDMTMTEFQRLCEARQRKAYGDRPRPLSEDEAAETMEWAQEIRKRMKKHGNHVRTGRRG